MAKTAIITGSDSGIGKAAAIALARDGYDIGITWHEDEQGAQETADEVQQYGNRAEVRRLDLSLSRLPAAAGVIDDLADTLGRVDALINNAGTSRSAPFSEMSWEDWRHVLAVDLDGPFLVGQRAAQRMIAQGEGGHIVNVTSVHEFRPLVRSANYTAAKHGLGGLTKSMALELVEYGILVNSVAPGMIATPMTGLEDEDVQRLEKPKIPMMRPGDAREIASIIAWLCSEEASYTTGQSFVIDGGFTLKNPSA